MSSRNMSYRGAIRAALEVEMANDRDVVLFGEDIAVPGGVFQVTSGLFEKFGGDRVFDTPISEQAIVGCAIGAAITGLRPVAEIMFADFAAVAYDQIANQLAKFRYQTNGQTAVPVTIRLMNGSGGSFAAQHSQSAENWLLNHPGLRICVPATPNDAYGLLRSAIRDENPVLFFEHRALYNDVGLVDESARIPIGKARLVRAGQHISLVSTQRMLERCSEAAELLNSEGVDAEILDLRTLSPLDIEGILESVRKTGRLLCVQETPLAGSWGSWVVAEVVGAAFDLLLEAPIALSARNTPIPYSPTLEDVWSPGVEEIVDRVRQMVGSQPGSRHGSRGSE